MINKIADNVWAFLMIVLGVAAAIAGAHMQSKDLIALGGTVAGYGAGAFRGGDKSPAA